MMRRIVQERTGGPEVLVVTEAPLPEPAAGKCRSGFAPPA